MPSPVQRFKTAARRVRRLEAQLADARRELRAALVDARKAGMTQQQLADEMGVTRQRVKALLDEITGRR